MDPRHPRNSPVQTSVKNSRFAPCPSQTPWVGLHPNRRPKFEGHDVGDGLVAQDSIPPQWRWDGPNLRCKSSCSGRNIPIRWWRSRPHSQTHSPAKQPRCHVVLLPSQSKLQHRLESCARTSLKSNSTPWHSWNALGPLYCGICGPPHARCRCPCRSQSHRGNRCPIPRSLKGPSTPGCLGN